MKMDAHHCECVDVLSNYSGTGTVSYTHHKNSDTLHYVKTHVASNSACYSTTYYTICLTQYSVGGKIEKNEMGRACGAYGGGKRCAQGSGGGTGGKETIGETQT